MSEPLNIEAIRENLNRTRRTYSDTPTFLLTSLALCDEVESLRSLVRELDAPRTGYPNGIPELGVNWEPCIKCKTLHFKYWKFCPDCGEKIEKHKGEQQVSEPLDIEAIRARANAAAEGPWHTEYNDTWVSGPVVDGDWDWIIGEMPTDDEQTQEDYRGKKIKENCIFVAHARLDIPALCDEVETLKNKLAIAEAALEEIAELSDRAHCNRDIIVNGCLTDIGMLDREQDGN